MITAGELIAQSWKREQRTKELEQKDMVNHPAHYEGKIECIEAIEVVTDGLTGFKGYCVGNIFKYLWRWNKKNGLEDLKKARWYLDKLIAKVEKQ